MKDMFDVQSQVLCLDIPGQSLEGVEHKDQGLLVVLHGVDGLQIQFNLERKKKLIRFLRVETKIAATIGKKSFFI